MKSLNIHFMVFPLKYNFVINLFSCNPQNIFFFVCLAFYRFIEGAFFV